MGGADVSSVMGGRLVVDEVTEKKASRELVEEEDVDGVELSIEERSSKDEALVVAVVGGEVLFETGAGAKSPKSPKSSSDGPVVATDSDE